MTEVDTRKELAVRTLRTSSGTTGRYSVRARERGEMTPEQKALLERTVRRHEEKPVLLEHEITMPPYPMTEAERKTMEEYKQRFDQFVELCEKGKLPPLPEEE